MGISRPKITWRCGQQALTVGERTFVMGILNVTPDSFSDGGRFLDVEAAIAHGLQMAEDGVDIIDVGGESTRPGADPVSAQDEAERVVPVIEALHGKVDCLLSVDTMKASVARSAVSAGAAIINDVSALSHDPEVVRVAAETGVGVVLMHMRGEPRTMQRNPVYENVVDDVRDYLSNRLAACKKAGIANECIAVDPGIGFGKTVEHNLQLISGLPAFAAWGRPVLVGLSRKSFIGRITGREVDDRLAGTLAATAYALTRGAHIIRVHDTKDSCDMARIIDMLMCEEPHGDFFDTDTMA